MAPQISIHSCRLYTSICVGVGTGIFFGGIDKDAFIVAGHIAIKKQLVPCMEISCFLVVHRGV